MEKTLDKVFPILEVDQDCILSKMGDLTVAYELRLPEIFTLSEMEFELFHQSWVKAIRTLPNHSVLNKQDWFIKDRHREHPSDREPSFLDQASGRYFHERPYLDHRCYLMLTKKPKGRKPSSSIFSNLIRPNLVPRELIDGGSYKQFMESCGQFVSILEESGLVRLKRIGNSELSSELKKKGLIERYCSLSDRGDDLRIRDMDFSQGIRIGHKQAQLYTLCDADSLPSLCGSRLTYERYSTDLSKFSIGFASPLGQLLPCNHIYNQYIFIEDPGRTLKKLESKKLRLQSLAAYSRQNLIAGQATNEFLNEAIAQQRQPVKAHFNVLVWTEKPEQLQELRNRVSSALSQIDCPCKEETVGAAQIFWAGIPGNSADFPMNESFDTFAAQAACLLNLETGYRNSVSPMGLRLGDRQTGRPMHVDISDEPMRNGLCTNRNKFILGPSGSGKSFFTNHMVRSYYEQGTHIVLVDVGHSYRGLCEMVSGYYFTYTEERPIRFNPFYIGAGDSLDTEKKESIKTLLLALWKKDDESFRRSEYVALSNAISGYYNFLAGAPSVFPSFDSFYEFLRDDFIKELEKERVKEKDFDVDNFLYVLRPFYQGGEFDYLLNASEDLDLLNERFIVFELDNIKDHPILFPVVTIIIMEVFINKMRKMKGVRKMILIEEAWKALMKEGFATYIKYLFKTVRKFFGEAVVVTQEVEDIISSAVVKQAIINNSDCKILLDQSKYQNRFEEIQQLLGLTEKERALILSMNKANDPLRKYKEVFISLGGTLSKVYRTEVSAEEYLVYTTEESEKVQLNKWIEHYKGDVKMALKAMAQELKKH